MVSDMSVFHRIEEVEAMPARRFFAFAVRLPVYSGALAARMAAAASAKPAQAASAPAPAVAAPVAAPRPSGQSAMPGTRTAIQASEFADLFSWGGA